jgi:hydroxypyruvate reductase
MVQVAREIFAYALEQSTVERGFARNVTVEGTVLRFGAEWVDLNDYDRVRVVAVGKAATPMLTALMERLPLRPGCDFAAVVAAPQAPAPLPPGTVYYAGGHPLPNQGSMSAAQTALEMLLALPRDAASAVRTLCIFLISGGASAMMEAPLDAAISLEDMAAFHRVLVHSGASIAEINCVRKHFSAVKGGRLALAAPRGATLLAFLVSDVPKRHWMELGSGPVLPDPTTAEQCHAVLEHYALMEKFPAPVRRFFAQARLPETPKSIASSMGICTLLDSGDLVAAAQERATQMGFRVLVDNTCDDWDHRPAARYLLERLRAERQCPVPEKSYDAQDLRPVCLLSAGEITVQIEGTPGVGGRNQQLALYAATQIKPEDAPLAVLSAGSDGVDGNSPAAGAVVDASTLSRAAQIGVDVEHSLATFDSGPVFEALGDSIITGPTGNNLRDLRVLLGTAWPYKRKTEVPVKRATGETRKPTR